MAENRLNYGKKKLYMGCSQSNSIVQQLKEEKMRKIKVFLVLLLQLMALHAWASTGQTLDLFKELMSFEINIDDSFAKFIRQHKISRADAHEMIFAADLLSGEESIIRDLLSLIHYLVCTFFLIHQISMQLIMYYYLTITRKRYLTSHVYMFYCLNY